MLTLSLFALFLEKHLFNSCCCSEISGPLLHPLKPPKPYWGENSGLGLCFCWDVVYGVLELDKISGVGMYCSCVWRYHGEITWCGQLGALGRCAVVSAQEEGVSPVHACRSLRTEVALEKRIGFVMTPGAGTDSPFSIFAVLWRLLAFPWHRVTPLCSLTGIQFTAIYYKSS